MYWYTELLRHDNPSINPRELSRFFAFVLFVVEMVMHRSVTGRTVVEAARALGDLLLLNGNNVDGDGVKL